MRCYLICGTEALGDATPCDTVAEAIRTFADYAEECDRFGQGEPEGAIHYRDERQHDEPKVAEYPEWALSIGPRGAVRRERC